MKTARGRRTNPSGRVGLEHSIDAIQKIGADQQRPPRRAGEELGESDEQKAQRLVGEMLQAAGWTETELRKHSKVDKKKARMAARLREETTMSWNWIAKRLAMGHWRTLPLLYEETCCMTHSRDWTLKMDKCNSIYRPLPDAP